MLRFFCIAIAMIAFAANSLEACSQRAKARAAFAFYQAQRQRLADEAAAQVAVHAAELARAALQQEHAEKKAAEKLPSPPEKALTLADLKTCACPSDCTCGCNSVALLSAGKECTCPGMTRKKTAATAAGPPTATATASSATAGRGKGTGPIRRLLQRIFKGRSASSSTTTTYTGSTVTTTYSSEECAGGSCSRTGPIRRFFRGY